MKHQLIMKITILNILLIFTSLTNVWSAPTRITVDPAGEIKSLSAARDAVRELRAGGEKGDIDVVINNGTYTLDKTLIFGLEDSAPDGAVTRYKAADGARPLVSGGKMIKGWEKTNLQDGKIWKAPVPWARGDGFFHALYDGEKLLPRARSGKFTSHPEWIATREDKAPGAPKKYFPKTAGDIKYRMTVTFPDKKIGDWENLEDIELFGQPSARWLVNYLGIKSVDTEQHVAHLRVPATYTARGKFYVENSIEYLDTPGEWVLNSKEGMLYYWPKSGAPGDRIIAPFLNELIRVAGVSDPSLEGANDKPVEGIEFIGLHLAHADRQEWLPEDKGLQHDWNMWDKANGLIRFRGAKRCAVRNCLFSESGSDGVRLDLYCQNITVEGSTFRNLGGTGVLLAGYGPGKKDVNKHNLITENEFVRVGQLFLHSPGIFIWQSGKNTISHNHIHDLPYAGMVVSGVRCRFFNPIFERMGITRDPFRIWDFPEGTRENIPTIRWDEITLPNPYDWKGYEPYMHARGNIIEFNEIHDVLKLLGDGNCIYLSANGKGNIVRYNATYNHPGGAMIRTDDDSHGVLVSHNLAIGTKSQKGYDIKGLNEVRYNIFINAILNASGVGNPIDPKCMIHQNIMFYKGRLKLKPSKYWSTLEGGLRNNLYYATDGGAEEYLEKLKDLTKSPDATKNSIVADPMFVDFEKGDLGFRPESPAIKMGIEPMTRETIAKMGMSRDPFINRYGEMVRSLSR